MFLCAGRAGSVSHLGAGQSGHQQLMLCLFYPVLFALTLEEFLHKLELRAGYTLAQGCVNLHSWGWSSVVLSLPAPAAPALGQGLRSDNPRGAFQPHPSMILREAGKDYRKTPERQRGALADVQGVIPGVPSITTAARAGAAPVLCLCPLSHTSVPFPVFLGSKI